MTKLMRETIRTGIRAPGMQAILDQSPELKQLLRQRMQDFPEYEAFLQHFGTGVLAAIEDRCEDQRSVA
jgi:hypothetical protein